MENRRCSDYSDRYDRGNRKQGVACRVKWRQEWEARIEEIVNLEENLEVRIWNMEYSTNARIERRLC